jgi:type IV pilus assembly protein PilN
MYSLDINLLNERSGHQTGQESSGFSATSTMAQPAKYGKVPLFVGAGVAALALLGSGGGWLWTNQQTERLEAKQKDLDTKLGSLKVQEARLQQVTAQVDQVTGESKSLSSVFDRVQPLSAVLQDLRENTPQGIQIDDIKQQSEVATTPTPTAATTPASGGLINKISTPPNPEAKPSPSSSPATTTTAPAPTTGTTATTTTSTVLADAPIVKLVIAGKAKSYEEVNNFVLTLKQSAFFNPDDVQLNNAELIPALPLSRVSSNGTIVATDPREPHFELPKVVGYQITTSLKRVPSGDLMRELERKGAVGLVARLKTLKQQQGVKP